MPLKQAASAAMKGPSCDGATEEVLTASRYGAITGILLTRKRQMRALQDALTYRRINLKYGRSPRGGIKPITTITPCRCYSVREKSSGNRPAILFSSGHILRVREALKSIGVALRYRDRTKYRPNVFDTDWSSVADFDFRYRQEELLRLIVNTPLRMGYIRAATGYGKSVIPVLLSKVWHKARIAVISHSAAVVSSLYDRISAEFPAGICTGSKRSGLHERLVVCSGKSMHRLDPLPDIMLLDEAQEFGTKHYFELLSRFPNTIKFGFSANSYDHRRDNFGFELEGILGPQIFDLPYSEAVENGVVAQLSVVWLRPPRDLDVLKGASSPVAKLRRAYWRNLDRNRLVAKVAEEGVRRGRQVLIVVSSLEHACHLKSLLPEFVLCYSSSEKNSDQVSYYQDIGMLLEGEPTMTRELLEGYRKSFESGELRAVIATSVWNRGVNFTGLDVLIRADGGSGWISDIQIPGRLSRIKDGKLPKLVDFMDTYSSWSKSRSSNRRSHYAEMGWRQVDVSEPYEVFK